VKISFEIIGSYILYYNNNAVFADIIDIYGPHFFIYGPSVLLMPQRYFY